MHNRYEHVGLFSVQAISSLVYSKSGWRFVFNVHPYLLSVLNYHRIKIFSRIRTVGCSETCWFCNLPVLSLAVGVQLPLPLAHMSAKTKFESLQNCFFLSFFRIRMAVLPCLFCTLLVSFAYARGPATCTLASLEDDTCTCR